MAQTRSLRQILLLAFLPILIVAFAIATLVIEWRYHVDEQAAVATIREERLNTNRILSQFVEKLIQNAVASAKVVAAAWPEIARIGDPGAELQTLERLSWEFSQLWIVDSDGVIRYASSAEERGRSLIHQPYWQSYMAKGETRYSDVVEAARGGKVVRILTPIANLPGQTLVATFDLEQLQRVLWTPEAEAFGRYTLLVDKSGKPVAQQGEGVPPGGHLSDFLPVQRALSGKTGIYSYSDGKTGQERVAVYRPIPTTGWALVSTHPRQHELLLVLSRTRLNSLLALSVALLIGLASTVWMSIRLARPVERLSSCLEEPPDQRPLAQLASFAVLESGVREYDAIAERMAHLRDRLREKTGALENRNLELARVNEQLEEALGALRQLEKLRTDFINMIGHDLRIPLTSIIGFAELTEDLAGERCPDVLPYMTQITAACRSMTEQLEQLLDHARMRTGHLKLAREALVPAEELDRVAEFFRPLAEAKGLTLLTAIPETLPMLMADRQRLEQILHNLLSNAIKYTHGGGTVVLRARAEPDWLVIEVEDTGIGLTHQDLEHLFKQFFRSERPEVQAQAGAGLGLAGTKAMIEAHGGTIEVESEVQRGAIFRVRLPLRFEPT